MTNATYDNTTNPNRFMGALLADCRSHVSSLIQATATTVHRHLTAVKPASGSGRVPALRLRYRRHALPCPGGPGPRRPGESPAGDHPDVLPRASGRRREDPARPSGRPGGVRSEPAGAPGLPDSIRGHL